MWFCLTDTLEQGGRWDWISTSRNVEGFRHWLDANETGLRSGAFHRAFGNHRKYQSLNAWRPNGTGDCVQSYVTWIKSSGDHATLFSSALARAAGDPELCFRQLYGEMRVVRSFGRMARFDYLSMIGKVGIASIQPDSVHFDGATGPVEGAKLLFFNNRNADVSTKVLERLSDALADTLGLNKQAMEDSICNWQKSPNEKIGFRG
jgi:Alpha-glutamyl/putrescinyl thymine pyrophosphorylase clade 3